MNYFEVTFKPTRNQLKFLLNSSIEIRLSVLFGQALAQLRGYRYLFNHFYISKS